MNGMSVRLGLAAPSARKHEVRSNSEPDAHAATHSNEASAQKRE